MRIEVTEVFTEALSTVFGRVCACGFVVIVLGSFGILIGDSGAEQL